VWWVALRGIDLRLWGTPCDGANVCSRREDSRAVEQGRPRRPEDEGEDGSRNGQGSGVFRALGRVDKGERMCRRGKTGREEDSVLIMGLLSVGKREVEGE
jgi:hypothetical protein